MKNTLKIALAGIGIVLPLLAQADDVCYANGTNWPVGKQMCMGGQMMVCDHNGWTPLAGGPKCDDKMAKAGAKKKAKSDNTKADVTAAASDQQTKTPEK
ncbi:MAG: hypothetical protein JO142_04865 [Burkholderiales bacterium]|nr:hypothetical protein [Burkholderiales bacterium]